MRNPFRRSSFTTVIAAAAILVVAGSGTAYAAGLITSAKIKDNTIQSVDVRDNTLKSRDVLDNSLASVDILNNSITGADVKDGSLTGADVADFSLSNQDVGVLFATVNDNGTIANSSGGVTGTDLGTGIYEINFHRDVSQCAFTATVGDAAPGSTQGHVVSATDRAGTPEAVFVRTSDSADTVVDEPFHLVVVC